MIALNKFKKLLGKAADGLTDKQIEEIRDLEYRIADAILDKWRREQGSHTSEPICESDDNNV